MAPRRIFGADGESVPVGEVRAALAALGDGCPAEFCVVDSSGDSRGADWVRVVPMPYPTAPRLDHARVEVGVDADLWRAADGA